MIQSSQNKDWGAQLSSFISASEARVSSYKKLKGEAYRNKDEKLVEVFKAAEKDEEKWLKALRIEKTSWNAGMWLCG